MLCLFLSGHFTQGLLYTEQPGPDIKPIHRINNDLQTTESPYCTNHQGQGGGGGRGKGALLYFYGHIVAQDSVVGKVLGTGMKGHEHHIVDNKITVSKA